eukprot:3686645-Ditylum_brightwellii.AAC.1
MVVIRWKDLIVLKAISTVMVKGATTVQRWTGQEVETVECPNDICDYQDGMGAVDKGDQHRALGAAFCNVIHFKKCWNLSANELAALRCGGT